MGRNPKAVTSAIVMGIGALVVGLAFVLPWVSVLSIAGSTIAALPSMGYLYLLPAAALLGLIWAVYVGSKGTATTGMAVAGVATALLALAPIVLMFIQMQPAPISTNGLPADVAGALAGLALQALGLGFWASIVGAVIMLAGALISFSAREAVFAASLGPTVVAVGPVVAPPPPASMAFPVPPPTIARAQPPNFTQPQSSVAKTAPMGGQAAPAAWLVMQGGSHNGQQFGLKRGDNNVGRDGNRSDIVVDDSSISGQHARVRYESGQFWLYDLASTNGTFINNSRVQKQILYDNDRVRLGEVTLVFKIVEQRR